MSILSVGVEFSIRTDRQTVGCDEAFRNFANAPKNHPRKKKRETKTKEVIHPNNRTSGRVLG